MKEASCGLKKDFREVKLIINCPFKDLFSLSLIFVMKAGKILDSFTAKNGKKVIIRFLKFEDWPDCLRLINSLVEEDAMILANKKVNKEKELEWISKQLNLLESGKGIVLVAEVDGKVVGICDIRKGKYRQSHVGTLGISVAKAYRGIGIGKALMKKALELAKKELKLKIVTLEVFEKNKIARKLYEKMGFKVYGRLPKALQYKRKLEANLCMYKELA